MSIKPITHESEDRLLRTVSAAIGYHNSGTPASAAMAKAASLEGLNMDFTKRAIHTFNVSKTLKHFKDNREDGEKRASSFDKADPEEVFALMLNNIPTDIGTKAASVREGEMRDFATIRRDDMPSMVKTAYEKPLGEISDARLKINRVLGEKKREVARVKSASLQVSDRQRDSFLKLVDSFRISGSYAYPTFRKEAADRYGDCVEPLLKALDCRVGKQGLTSKDFMAAKKAFDMFDTLLATIDESSAAETNLKKAQAELDEMQGKVDALWKAPITKEAAPSGGGFLGDFLDKYIGGPPSGAKVKDTGFGDKVRAIGSQAELTRLLSTDTVLSQYDPGEVQMQYNELVRTTPDIANRPAILRAQLRKSMESSANPMGGANMDPFEMGQLAKTMKDLRTTAPSSAGSSSFGGDDDE